MRLKTRPSTKAAYLAAAIVHVKQAQAYLSDLYFPGSPIVAADLRAARQILLDAALAEPELPGPTGQGGGL